MSFHLYIYVYEDVYVYTYVLEGLKKNVKELDPSRKKFTLIES